MSFDSDSMNQPLDMESEAGKELKADLLRLFCSEFGSKIPYTKDSLEKMQEITENHVKEKLNDSLITPEIKIGVNQCTQEFEISILFSPTEEEV